MIYHDNSNNPQGFLERRKGLCGHHPLVLGWATLGILTYLRLGCWIGPTTTTLKHKWCFTRKLKCCFRFSSAGKVCSVSDKKDLFLFPFRKFSFPFPYFYSAFLRKVRIFPLHFHPYSHYCLYPLESRLVMSSIKIRLTTCIYKYTKDKNDRKLHLNKSSLNQRSTINYTCIWP
jgi:hypothetical protein